MVVEVDLTLTRLTVEYFSTVQLVAIIFLGPGLLNLLSDSDLVLGYENINYLKNINSFHSCFHTTVPHSSNGISSVPIVLARVFLISPS